MRTPICWPSPLKKLQKLVTQCPKSASIFTNLLCITVRPSLLPGRQSLIKWLNRYREDYLNSFYVRKPFMNQSKNLLFFGSFVIFVGLMWLSLQTCGDTNSVSATPSPTPSPTPAPTAAPSKKKQGAAVATPAPTATPSRPSRVILTTPYVIQDRSTDVRTNAIEQQQQVTTQEMTAVRQELDALNGSVSLAH